MPEGDTIAYAANRIRPVLEGRVPESIATPQPRHRARPLARAPKRAPGERGRHAWQAPVPALRRGPGAAFTPGDDGSVGRLPRRPALAAVAAAGVAGDALAGSRRGRVRRADARADDRGPHALRSAAGGARARRARRAVRRRRGSCG